MALPRGHQRPASPLEWNKGLQGHRVHQHVGPKTALLTSRCAGPAAVELDIGTQPRFGAMLRVDPFRANSGRQHLLEKASPLRAFRAIRSQFMDDGGDTSAKLDQC